MAVSLQPLPQRPPQTRAHAAPPVMSSANDPTSASAHRATQAQSTPSQGIQNEVSGAQPHLRQGHSTHHPIDSYRYANDDRPYDNFFVWAVKMSDQNET
jgi:hypothetical protein